jgi:hypothetical protein
VTGDGDLSLSDRVCLARLAGQAIAVSDGVTATTGPAGRWLTIASAHSVAGVLAVEGADGRVDIEMHLLAHWPPQMSLQQLAQHVRERLRRSAGMAGLDERLGAVGVFFDDVLTRTDSG